MLLRVFDVAFRDVGNQAPLTVLLRGVICIYKKADVPAEELTSLRPIMLLNCDAKLIMLVVSIRLQRPLDYVIDITQSAFLRGRDINDNDRWPVGPAARAGSAWLAPALRPHQCI